MVNYLTQSILVTAFRGELTSRLARAKLGLISGGGFGCGVVGDD